MKDYTASTYGERIAEFYDEWYGDLDPEAVVELLAELAGPGPVLELGVGTGRVALPLRTRGIAVHGIDASQAMVDKLRAKPGGAGIPVTIGDLADVAIEGKFSLVFVAFNTFFCLLTQEDQLRCFANVAARLARAGLFVLEAFVPDLSRFDRNQRVAVEKLESDAVRLETSVHDPVGQQVETRHVVISAKQTTLYPLKIRYAWPSELDLMARLAGLRLRERWGGWRHEPFDASSRSHISVYELASS